MACTLKRKIRVKSRRHLFSAYKATVSLKGVAKVGVAVKVKTVRAKEFYSAAILNGKKSVLHRPCCVCGTKVEVFIHFGRAQRSGMGRLDFGSVRKVKIPLCGHHYTELTRTNFQSRDYQAMVRYLEGKKRVRMGKFLVPKENHIDPKAIHAFGPLRRIVLSGGKQK